MEEADADVDALDRLFGRYTPEIIRTVSVLSGDDAGVAKEHLARLRRRTRPEKIEKTGQDQKRSDGEVDVDGPVSPEDLVRSLSLDVRSHQKRRAGRGGDVGRARPTGTPKKIRECEKHSIRQGPPTNMVARRREDPEKTPPNISIAPEVTPTAFPRRCSPAGGFLTVHPRPSHQVQCQDQARMTPRREGSEPTPDRAPGTPRTSAPSAPRRRSRPTRSAASSEPGGRPPTLTPPPRLATLAAAPRTSRAGCSSRWPCRA